MNIIFILSDDHRYDAMGFTGRFKGLETPGLDRLAAEGAVMQNAFVTTSLCSPSRASILTGQYAHTHTVVDNDSPLPAGLTFFSQYLQQKNYQTAFIGKWHIGGSGTQPQRGFDHWISFEGQGVYYNPRFNINGREVTTTDSTYITDTLTGFALNWLKQRDAKRPFMLYLSHKGVHAEFMPARRHRGRYAQMPVQCPPSMYLTATEQSKSWGISQAPATAVNYAGIPQWVRRQRFSWHGVDYMYHGYQQFDGFYRNYLETLLAIDESVANVRQWVVDNGLAENTMIVYMGDNGFSFGEHGLIDKRHAYEESMRVPMLIWAPGLVRPGTQIGQMVQGIDIAPTFLALAGLPTPTSMQGQSMLPLLTQAAAVGRTHIFYEYYWELPFPQTPTMFAVRNQRYKYIYYFGVWDTNELYDLQTDPWEMNNLIASKAHETIGRDLRQQLFTWLQQTNGLQIPLKKPVPRRIDHLYEGAY
ncbi:MAG TPA: sulfatase [Phnomibacter sp.]|nr:sulfatase [Phnomibacter sp.]